MPTNPKVSVGLPVYNGANYVEESILSILNQTYTDFEFIISDNASTDGTAEICRSYAARDPRIRYYRQEKNRGCAWNSNFVLEKAFGTYFKWISHDDLHAPRFIECCVEVLDKDPSVVICCPKGVLIDETGREIQIEKTSRGYCYTSASGKSLQIRPYDRARRLESPAAHERFRDLVRYTNWCLEIYGLVRTEVLRRTSLHGAYHGTDKRILAELSLMGKFKLLPEVMLFYRQHPVQAQRYSGSAQARDIYLAGDVSPQRSKLPRWNNLCGYTRAVINSDLGVAARLACLAGIGMWFLQPAKWRPLFLEGTENLTTKLPHRQSRSSQGSLSDENRFDTA